MSKTLFKNGTVIHADRISKEDILIHEEKIIKVEPKISPESNTTIIDCDHKYIFPGVIDPHTHMGIPIKGGYSTDDFTTGSQSALNGGVTTIIDFSILESDQSLQESVQKRLSLAEKSHADYSMHCNITRFSESLLDEIPKLIQNGIISFKVFTTYKEAGMMLAYSEIKQVAQVIQKYNGILMVHAEDDEVVQSALTPLLNQSLVEPFYHGLSRPSTSEEVAVKQLANIADETGCKIYIVHLNSAEGLKAASRSNNILIETCPHYLLLDDAVYYRDDGRMFVASPPLRTRDDSNALWNGIINNQIHTLGTDHCPFCRSDKAKDVPFQNIPNGMGGVETLFPVMLAEWLKRQLDLSKLVELISLNPAKIFGLYPKKGSISVECDADLLIVDPKDIDHKWETKLVSITDWNAFTDFPAIFPEQVWLRGNQINTKELINAPSKGQFIPGNI